MQNYARRSILLKKEGNFLFMSRSQKRSHRLVKWLADAIMIEMEKPYDEINVEFVESCENLLNTLMGEKKLSDKEINDRVNEIMERSGKNYAVPVRRRSKPALIALIAAVIFVLSCVTVCATTTLDEYILKSLDLDINQCVTDDRITYSNKGKNTIYSTIPELLEEENLNICYPEKIAYDIAIEKIIHTETNETFFSFSDAKVSFDIYHNDYRDLSVYNISEIIEYNNFSFHLVYTNDYNSAYANINNDFYVLVCDSKEQLLDMIYSFNFERIN